VGKLSEEECTKQIGERVDTGMGRAFMGG